MVKERPAAGGSGGDAAGRGREKFRYLIRAMPSVRYRTLGTQTLGQQKPREIWGFTAHNRDWCLGVPLLA